MLEQNINDFINMRIENLSNFSKLSKEYIEELDKATVFFNKLIKLLPNEKELLFDYEDAIGSIFSYEVEESYKGGFKDCFNLFLNLICKI